MKRLTHIWWAPSMVAGITALVGVLFFATTGTVFAANPITRNVTSPIDATIKYTTTLPPSLATFNLVPAGPVCATPKAGTVCHSANASATGTLSIPGTKASSGSTYNYDSGNSNLNFSGTVTGLPTDYFEVCSPDLTRTAQGAQICSAPWQTTDLFVSVSTLIKLAGTYVPANGAAGGGAATGTTTSKQSPTCTENGDPLTYVLCPVFNAMASTSDFLFNSIVEPFLITTPVSTSGKDPSFQIWSAFRVYGDIFLVIAVLVAVIGQAIGG